VNQVPRNNFSHWERILQYDLDMAKPMTLKRAWLVSVLAYSLIRTFIIWKVFQKYGVNQYIYLVIDITCAFFFAKFSTKVLLEANQTHYRKLLKNLFFTLIFNFIPDMYVLLTAKEVPKFLYESFVQVILILAIVSAFTLYRSYKQRKN
jgi:hypothetical protein